MKIEEAIKQNKYFRNEYEKMAVNILFTSSWIESLMLHRLKPFGISLQQHNVLRILRGAYPNPRMLTEIADRMVDKNSNATRLVEKLKAKGLLTREQSLSDRRQVDITITQKGLDLLAELDKTAEKWLSTFYTLNHAEAELLNAALDKLRG
jgi:DNA-binding MarR family transcriptional regulator